MASHCNSRIFFFYKSQLKPITAFPLPSASPKGILTNLQMLCANFVCHIAELQKHKRSVQNTDWIGTRSWQLTHPFHPRFYSLFGLFRAPLLVVDREHAPVIWRTAGSALPPGPGGVRLVAAIPDPGRRLVPRVPVVLLAAPQQVLLLASRGWAPSAERERILDSFERYVPSIKSYWYESDIQWDTFSVCLPASRRLCDICSSDARSPYCYPPCLDSGYSHAEDQKR